MRRKIAQRSRTCKTNLVLEGSEFGVQSSGFGDLFKNLGPAGQTSWFRVWDLQDKLGGMEHEGTVVQSRGQVQQNQTCGVHQRRPHVGRRLPAHDLGSVCGLYSMDYNGLTEDRIPWIDGRGGGYF